MQGAVSCLSVMMVSLSGFAVVKGPVWRLKRHGQHKPGECLDGNARLDCFSPSVSARVS